ncbi:hypothetical protein NK718_17580 [Alsobacter sp. SYSU M60028]|uniref:Uncharacterized protein n=1 Tax=Alsobacter ponti TaxID=2962936 RepID=A0ABT1LHA9_9HYPH|nr:hypothetical protein [Alsobacter ponti]MCP8940341.1 hypothetical protein [Alsobacter ponti]
MDATADTLLAFQALLLGVASAGVLATGFEALTRRPASFALLETGGGQALASVPLIVFTAPFIILRNTLRGRRFERRPLGFVAAATAVACLWSLASGRVIFDLVLALIG